MLFATTWTLLKATILVLNFQIIKRWWYVNFHLVFICIHTVFSLPAPYLQGVFNTEFQKKKKKDLKKKTTVQFLPAEVEAMFLKPD